MIQLMEDKKLLGTLFETYGSPLNIHYLPEFDRNIQTFREVFEKHKIRHQLFYARKANKNQSVVKRAKENGIGVDTASFRELRQALDAGLEAEKLVKIYATAVNDYDWGMVRGKPYLYRLLFT